MALHSSGIMHTAYMIAASHLSAALAGSPGVLGCGGFRDHQFCGHFLDNAKSAACDRVSLQLSGGDQVLSWKLTHPGSVICTGSGSHLAEDNTISSFSAYDAV